MPGSYIFVFKLRAEASSGVLRSSFNKKIINIYDYSDKKISNYYKNLSQGSVLIDYSVINKLN